MDKNIPVVRVVIRMKPRSWSMLSWLLNNMANILYYCPVTKFELLDLISFTRWIVLILTYMNDMDCFGIDLHELILLGQSSKGNWKPSDACHFRN